jgi:hypothetical protein
LVATTSKPILKMNTSTTTCEVGASSTICTTETIQNFVGGFSYGEILMILILLMIFSLKFFAELKLWIFGQKVENPMKNKYNLDI